MWVIQTRSVVASVVAWTVGATIALGVSLLALSLVSTGLTNEPVQPVTRDVGTSANQPTPTPSDATPAPYSTTKGDADTTANQRSLSFVGGTVVARCRTGGAYLVYWSPAPGYRVDDVVRGPREPAGIQGQSREVKISVTCVTGTPQATTDEEEHHDD